MRLKGDVRFGVWLVHADWLRFGTNGVMTPKTLCMGRIRMKWIARTALKAEVGQ